MSWPSLCHLHKQYRSAARENPSDDGFLSPRGDLLSVWDLLLFYKFYGCPSVLWTFTQESLKLPLPKHNLPTVVTSGFAMTSVPRSEHSLVSLMTASKQSVRPGLQ